jgi:serine/threonine protein kinase
MSNLRIFAANILSGNCEDLMEHEEFNINAIKSAPLSSEARSTISGAIATSELVKLAETKLNERSTSAANPAQFTEIKSILQELKSEVDVETYQRANPDPLDAIPEGGTVRLGRRLGQGQTAVYEATVTDSEGNAHEVAVKPFKIKHYENGIYVGSIPATGARNQEARAIEHLRAANVLHPNDLVSKADGLRVIATPKVMEDGTIVMEKIPGMDVEKAIYSEDPSLSPFANGYVDDPQQAISRTAGILYGLNSLHENGLVHHDIKSGNLMITGNQSEFSLRLIDVGTVAPIGDPSPGTDTDWAPPEFVYGRTTAHPSDDMYRFATTLPVLLFGRAGRNLQSDFWNSRAGEFAVMRKRQSKDRLHSYVFQKLNQTNQAMQTATGTSYPNEVMQRFAGIMVDCLSADPSKRPTAEQVFLGVQNMGFSDWNAEPTTYTVERPALTTQEAEIQGQFWWINGMN